MTADATYTTFAGHRRIAAGPLLANALAVRRALAEEGGAAVLVFDDATGRVVDVDTRGSDADIAARLGVPAVAPADAAGSAGSRGRGRPRLGVVAREVTLLPRHWDWLAAQPGGASVVLRRLVDDARRAGAGRDQRRQAHERAYHFMAALAGDLPGFEEATRALFADDGARVGELTAAWPPDVRAHVMRLAFGSDEAAA